jgi:hypothetical protein
VPVTALYARNIDLTRLKNPENQQIPVIQQKRYFRLRFPKRKKRGRRVENRRPPPIPAENNNPRRNPLP